ncbi:MAG: glucose-6-phosphate isomerase [Verrucomicrobia bacterium]|nr:MAG: glucose-6-phosphate isomerase [Verrucomicrobiota bacterium]
MDWNRFKNYYLSINKLNFSLDISRMNFNKSFFDYMEEDMQRAFSDMDQFEKGSIANPDENRMVGHYWLRNSSIAPNEEIKKAIDSNLKHIHDFAQKIHSGEIKSSSGPFKNMIIIGIGGSALGPQFVSQALFNPKRNRLTPYFFDNTDPDGFDLILNHLKNELDQTLVIIISKSGSTPETRNGMIEAEAVYGKAGLNFAKHAVAITGTNSQLDQNCKKQGWLDSFPLWDWVGGRTSELASVGLLPAALEGIDIDQMLKGARDMDEVTRSHNTKENPAALIALMWYHATNGKGAKDMVILPYKERLSLFSKYLQQLIMESLGKEKDLQGKIVHQGISVYGNKGSTDQHAYVQQLRDGINNFFVTFIEVLKDRETKSLDVDPGITSGDYLHAFLLGTREALSENNRESITITINEVTGYTVGALIALYERAVGFYASLININAYNQPGVEAGKKAAAATLSLQEKIVKFLEQNSDQSFDAFQIAEKINEIQKSEIVFKILDHLAANPDKPISKTIQTPFDKSTFKLQK